MLPDAKFIKLYFANSDIYIVSMAAFLMTPSTLAAEVDPPTLDR
jgi:CMP-N-acetylneuraminic acid synthetase